MCRRAVWETVNRIARSLEEPTITNVVGRENYSEMKREDVFEARARVKSDVKINVLKGWVENRGDEQWGINDGD